MEDEMKKIIDFEKRSWAIKFISTERWGNHSPCPIRFSVNPYQGCDFKCPYCYVWSGRETAVKAGFRKALKHDIERAKNMGLTSYVVELSASTDPFQYIETKEKEALFTIKELLDGGFKVLVVTKNPSVILSDEYSDVLKNDRLFIDVTITSLKEGTPQGFTLNNNGPSAEEKMKAVKEIIKRGKNVRIKIEPVVPSYENIKGQAPEDLKNLVEEAGRIGVKSVIAKTLRLNAFLPESVKSILLPFYKQNGVLVGSNYILSAEMRRKMLEPVFESCKRLGLKFCPCYDSDVFENEGNKAFCDVKQEPLKRMGHLYTNDARVTE